MPSDEEVRALDQFMDASARRPMLGLLYGRRRIGKTTLLVRAVRPRGGFYYEAARIDTGMQLHRLGAALGGGNASPVRSDAMTGRKDRSVECRPNMSVGHEVVSAG